MKREESFADLTVFADLTNSFTFSPIDVDVFPRRRRRPPWRKISVQQRTARMQTDKDFFFFFRACNSVHFEQQKKTPGLGL